MKTHYYKNALLQKATFVITMCLLCIATFAVRAQAPTAQEVASEMKIGWNLGNSLDVPGNETDWGNPPATQALIDQVKAAGFNTLRLPCAWDSYADQNTLTIDAGWLARVKEVVDYGISNNMYVILNSHWDGGWLEEHPFYSYQEAVNEKQNAYWTQIATYFQDYDEHLLFAGTNEVRADYGTPTSEHIEVQESYNQTFINAVRNTGGNNSNRILIVQTYNTNAWHGLNYFTAPNDPADHKLMVEIHHYDPYDFTLNPDNNAACTVWGNPWSTGSNCNWAEEAYTDDLFGQIKTKWVNNGIPVIIGEFGAVKRTSLTGTALSDHLAAREYYLEYIVKAATENGITPVYWDNGYNGDNGFALFDRNSTQVVDQPTIDALMAGVSDDGNPTPTNYTVSTSVEGSGSVSLTPAGGSYAPGTSVTITATPSSGWIFNQWSGSNNSTSATITITVNSNISLVASFRDENANPNACNNPSAVTLPFTFEGAGNYCWVTSSPMSYVNSWGLEELLINGEDYTNLWSNSFPAAIDGKWYIQYSGTAPWSHFEMPAAAGTRVSFDEDNSNTKIYPNPFNETLNIALKEKGASIIIRDLTGKILEKHISNDTDAVELGKALQPGTYYIELKKHSGSETIKVIKQ